MLPAASKDVNEILLIYFNLNSLVSAAPNYTHTHTHKYIYIYTSIYKF